MPSPLAIWIAAIRPATLWAGAVPVLVGAALAGADGHTPGVASIVALLGAILIQVGTNLVNDYADFKTGADGPDRLGPKRATAQGWLSPRAVLMGAGIALVGAACAGAYLSLIGGLPILVLGVVSIICAIAYTAGPWPLAYVGLGDIFVLAFFGLAAVCGTYYLETNTISVSSILAGIAIGSVATAILVVNNLRDQRTDARVGKRTLAVRFGARFTRIQYAVLLCLAYLCVVAAVVLEQVSPWSLLVLMTLPFAISETRGVFKKNGAALNIHLGGTARLELLFGLCFAGGVLL